MSERCYMHEGVHIPHCWGAVLRGKKGCTCPTKARCKKAVADIEFVENVLIDVICGGRPTSNDLNRAIEIVRELHRKIKNDLH